MEKLTFLFKKESLEVIISANEKGDEDTEKDEKVLFHSITYTDSTPDISLIKVGEFIKVVYRNTPYWALFSCPCSCGALISLPLQNTHKPNWRVDESKGGRPSVYPSIWQNKGCLSHFWIIDGKVNWSKNTGIEPWIAEPRDYPSPTN